ncbi:MAG TPA: DUF5671 domain-containing protein [Patescibacteria group bacterium]|nr:DUF5671 domain-containing protein [Patescibacteria group bacterium]
MEFDPQQQQQQPHQQPAYHQQPYHQPQPQPIWQPPVPEQVAQPQAEPVDRQSLRPMPVVRVLSPMGVEYVFLTVTLFIGAGSLMGTLLLLVNGATEFSALSFPVAALIVCVPLFAFLFLRLKKMEVRDPSLRFDASKRRSTQFTQIVAFIVSIFTLIGLVFTLFAKMGGDSTVSIGKALLDTLCVLVVAGGVLAYYWLDEHKSRR